MSKIELSEEEIEREFLKNQNADFAVFLRENYPEVGIRWDRSSFKAGAKFAATKYAERIRELEASLFNQKLQYEGHLRDLVYRPNPTSSGATIALNNLSHELDLRLLQSRLDEAVKLLTKSKHFHGHFSDCDMTEEDEECSCGANRHEHDTYIFLAKYKKQA